MRNQPLLPKPTGWVTLTADLLTAALAERVMGWKVTPDRFTKGDRAWSPRWKFSPTTELTDALRLLQAAVPDKYTMGSGANGMFWARVVISGVVGESSQRSQALALTIAIAHAIGIEMGSAK